MDPAAPAPSPPPGPPKQDPRRLLLKNTAILAMGQLIGAPMSLVVTAVIGRLLKSASYGELTIAGTWVTLGFLFVDWGQSQVMAAEIARDRSQAGRLLGTSLAWRVVAAVLVYGALAGYGALSLKGNAQEFQVLLALFMVQQLILSFTTATLDAIRGLERTDISAKQNILQPFLRLLIVWPALALLHWKARGAIVAQTTVSAALLVYVWYARGKVGIKPLQFSMAALKAFFKPGTAFLFFGLAMALQPFVDAEWLHHRAPLEVAGWNASARKLLEPLIMPAAVIGGPLYPTLTRLHFEDRAAFVSTLRAAIRGTLMLTFPIALSCAFYGDIGVWIFGKQEYAPAVINLAVLSPFLFLLYFSMPLGVSILASGRQKVWSAVQFICVAVSAILDPILIPIFQRRFGNGGLGVCVAAVISELFMVAFGIKLTDKAVFDRNFALGFVRAAGAGAAMSAVAVALRYLGLHSVIAAPIALLTYGVVLWAVGGLGGQQMEALLGGLKRRLRR